VTAALVRIGEIAEQLRGVTFAKSEAISRPASGYLPVLRATNIGDDGLNFDDLVYVPSERVALKQWVRKNDVLITTSSGSLSAIGRSARAFCDFEGGFGAFLKVLRPTPQVDPSYFAHFFRTPSYRTRVSSLAEGANINNLKAEHLNEIEIPLPTIEEQRRIAITLDHADDLVSKHRKSSALFDQLVESLFHGMFDPYAGPVRTVAEVAAPHKDAIRTGPFGSQLLTSEFVGSGVAVLGLDNVVGNEFRWAERRFISTEKYQQLRRYTVQPGDVLISIMGTTGRCVVVPGGIPTSINTKHLCAITVDERVVLPEFMRACFLWDRRSREHLRRQTKGSIMAGLNMGIVKSMPLPLPPLSDQAVFVERVRSIEAHRNSVRTALANASDVSAALQTRAFIGQL
jgi:type I restriction enzyme S subunit